MVKKFNHGGNFYPKDEKWVMDSRKPKDFLSLMRNIIHTKLSMHLGLKTRLLASKSGEFIYLLITADDELIKHQAE